MLTVLPTHPRVVDIHALFKERATPVSGTTDGHDHATLDRLIEELTVDAYGDEEQLSGFLVGAEDAVVKGEIAEVVGVAVRIVGVTAGPDVRSRLIIRCERDEKQFEIALLDLVFEAGSELGTVAAAYRRRLGL